LLQLGVNLGNLFDFVLDFLHVLTALVHLIGHLEQLLSFAFNHRLHLTVNPPLSLFELLVLILEVDELVSQPVDLVICVVAFASLTRLFFFYLA